MTKKEMFISWLNDAYGMEISKADLSKRYSDDLEKYPDLKNMFSTASSRATEMANQLKTIIEGLDGKISSSKSLLGKLGSMFQGGMDELAHDQPVKNIIAAYSGVHMGIASYTSLAAAARELGQNEVVTFSENAIAEGREMAKKIEEQISPVTGDFLREEHENDD